MVPEVGLEVGAGRRGRDKPIGRLVRPACGSATGVGRKDMKDTLTGAVWR
jgi:hypothetical protein